MATGSIDKLPLIVIVGPTASGKTALAVKLAEGFGGEIICADSRTVYKGMDIGTAKPSPLEQARVPHWGLDLVEPGQSFSVANFKRYATKKIDEIRRRRHIPFLVGGTGLYIDSVIFDYQFGVGADPHLRHQFEAMSTERLHGYCLENNISLPENKYNKRYLIRAIEQNGMNSKRRDTPISKTIIVGIATEKSILRKRIRARTEQLFENSVVGEATKLGKKYGWDNEAMKANIYPLIHSYLQNIITLEELKDKFTTLDWRLAKRQITWLKRNPHILWFDLAEAEHYLTTVLAEE